MSDLFEAWHLENIVEDDKRDLRRLLDNWNGYQCNQPCPALENCSFSRSSDAVEFYGWNSYFELFSACGHHLGSEPPLQEIPTKISTPATDLMTRGRRRSGHYDG